MIRQFVNPHGHERGLPTGIPLTTLSANLYLDDLDKVLSIVPGVFYARYGDDMLFAHTDPDASYVISKQLDKALAALGLKRHKGKDLMLYMTRGGIPGNDARWKSASRIEYIGFSIMRSGAIGFTKHRYLITWRRVKNYIDHCLSLSSDRDSNERCRLVCRALKQAYDGRSDISDRGVQDFLTMVDDRGQLKQFDYLVARYISEKITGIRGVKAFRKLSYQTLRQQFDLPSLVFMKNRLYE